MSAPLPANELERLEALRQLRILDTPTEAGFDRITSLVARLLDVPIALVSLVDGDRQWFKSCYGLGERSTSRDAAFCAHAILQDEVMVVRDAREDAFFADNPLVTGPPNIRFYAGAPIGLHSGLNLGTLCAIDTRPRDLNAQQRALLADLARLVESELRLRHVVGQLDQSRRSFLDLVESMPFAAGITSADGVCRYANASALFLAGAHDPVQVIGQPMATFLTPPFHDIEVDRRQHVLRERLPLPARDMACLTVDGREYTLEMSLAPTDFDEAPAVAWMARDVTYERFLERGAQSAAEVTAKERLLLLTTLENVGDGVVLLSQERSILLANRAYGELFGIPAAELTGMSRETFLAHFATLVDGEGEAQQRLAGLSSLATNTVDTFELARPHRRVLERIARTATIGNQPGYLVVWRDVTAAHDLARERERLATTDPLTELLNRRGADWALTRERAHARRTSSRLSIVLIDVDHFKRINDAHGHVAGDGVLRDISRIILREARGSDIVARWGGEEFLLILAADTPGAEVVAERVRVAVEAAALCDSPVTISAGVTTLAGPDEPLEAAVVRADARLYAAKHAGRNQVRADSHVVVFSSRSSS